MKKLILILCIFALFLGCKTTKPEPINQALDTSVISQEAKVNYESPVTPMEIESWKLMEEVQVTIPINPFFGIHATERYYVNQDLNAEIRYACIVRLYNEDLYSYAIMDKGQPYVFRFDETINTWENAELSPEGSQYWIRDFKQYAGYVPLIES